ncbi:MAG TPA: methionyl-tRNA formyltransferase [Candidatus Woesebacteria bacterium]|nr:methionyl-tRNA formyltransferase [Candidatus Woesebacteria bacterium]
MISLVFFGSSDHSVLILQKLLGLNNFSVNLVVTKIDKPFGRDQIITPNPVAKFAKDHHLNLLQIEEFTKDYKLQIKNYQADLGLCIAFGPPFFDQEMIDIFPKGIINIHPSPLPKYRGATPGPWQIINGETDSGVSFFLIDALPDHGPIIKTLSFTISPTDTAAIFYQKAFALASENLDQIISDYALNPTVYPQDHSQKSYFPKLTKDMGKIDWSQDDVKIDRFIRGLNPWPIAWTFVRNSQGIEFKMKIFTSKFDQKLILETVQLEGKTKTKWSEISPYYQIVK